MKSKIDNANKILLVTLFCMTLPLFLEYAVFVALILLRVVGGDTLRVFSYALGITGLLAAIAGVFVSGWFLLKRNGIKDAKTKSLGAWVVGLSLAYALIIVIAAVAFVAS